MPKTLLPKAGLVAILLAMAPVGAYAVPITDNLIAWWEFDSVGPGNSIADLSGNGHNLTIADNPFLATPGLPTVGPSGVGGGGALHSATGTFQTPIGGTELLPTGIVIYPDANPFGTDPSDAVDFSAPNGPTNPPGFAIQAWVNFNQVTLPAQTILSNNKPFDAISGGDNGWSLNLYAPFTGNPADPCVANPRLFFSSRTGAGGQEYQKCVPIAIGNWHHIVFTTDGVNGGIYFDGVNQGFTPQRAPLTGSNFDLFVGAERFKTFGTDFFARPVDGSIDKVALWERNLTPDDIALLYNQGNGFNLPLEQSVPTPGALSLMLLGVASLIAARRRRAQHVV